MFFSDSDDYSNCNMIYITKTSNRNINSILKNLQDSPVLTVSDTDGYSDIGVIINFYIEDDMLRFEINNETSKSANIKISYHLLKMSKVR